jgi:hypothetical protein
MNLIKIQTAAGLERLGLPGYIDDREIMLSNFTNGENKVSLFTVQCFFFNLALASTTRSKDFSGTRKPLREGIHYSIV